jgi:Domain of unknown function (DUF4331)
MGDHFSSPRVFDDPAADIADVYVFPSPDRPGRVVLVLTVFPSATVTSLFSDAITYRFRIRPVTVAGPGPGPGAGPGYAVGEDEWTFDFTFAGDGVGGLAQAGRCWPGGRTRPTAADRSTTTSWTCSSRSWWAGSTDRASATASIRRPGRPPAASPTWPLRTRARRP